MVAALDAGIAVGDQDFATPLPRRAVFDRLVFHRFEMAHHGSDGCPFDHRQFTDAAADHARTLAVAERLELNRFGGTAPQAVHLGNVAMAHMRQQVADRHHRRGNGDIDAPALNQVGVGAAVDDRQNPLATEFLGQQGGHDVVLVVAGQRHEEIGFLDGFLQQQILVGGFAVQDQTGAEPSGNVFRAVAVMVDHLDHTAAFQLTRHAQTDIAAPGDNHAAYRFLHAMQFKQYFADMRFGRQHENLVPGLDHRIGFRRQGAVTAEQCGNPGINVRPEVLAQFADRSADHRTARRSPYRHQSHAAIGKGQDL